MNQQYPSASPAPPTSSKKSTWGYILLIIILILVGISFFHFFYGLGKLPWPQLLMFVLIGLLGIHVFVVFVLSILEKHRVKKGLLVRNQTLPSKKSTLFARLWREPLIFLTILKVGILISVIVVSFIGAKERIERMREQQRKADMQFTETKEPKNGEDETADWKTYRNEEYGFEIKYPVDLSPEVKADIPADNIFSLYFGDGKIFRMGIYDTGMEGQIRLYTIEGTEKKVLIDNIEGSQFHKADMKGEVDYIPQTLVKNKGKLYLFIGEGKTFNQMLSTLRFLEEDPCNIINKLGSVEKNISKSCITNDDCVSRSYIDSLTNAVKCFRKGDPGLADYDYIARVYRENNCPMNLGGAPYTKVSCECVDGICTAILEP